LVILTIAGCGSVPDRNPVPEALVGKAHIPGIPLAREWGDVAPPGAGKWMKRTQAELRRTCSGIMGCEHHYLAISGGGQNGAFGAGILCGWTASGKRPEFTLVTGISTGALIAPFAFLGPAYDAKLKELYTTLSTDDLIERRSPLRAIFSDAMADTTKLSDLIAKTMDAEILRKVGEEYRRGRALLIGTTNLDAERPVIWNIGRIATSGDPKALELFHRVLLASASIPIAFPPVLIQVEADGRRFDEIHVDGGATTQVFLYPLGIDWGEVMKKLEVKGKPRVYVIRNGFLAPEWKAVDPPGLAKIAGQTVDSLIRTQGIGDLYLMYLGAKRDGLDYNLASIPADFDVKPTEAFDTAYMKKLFDRGYDMAKAGYPWKKAPPGYEERP